MKMSVLKTLSTNLLELFYPKICAACSRHLAKQEQTFCTICTLRFPFTNFHLHEKNPLQKKFWGRVQIHSIDSLLYLEKGSLTENLLYKLKYENRQDIGEALAKILLRKYQSISKIVTIQAILSIPLHPSKEKLRGYNQCSSFAYHLAQAWDIPYESKAIYRTHNNVSQTGKSRIDRWENVASIFALHPSFNPKGKHLLLIDDVITTGATLEACASILLKEQDVTLSIITMACKV